MKSMGQKPKEVKGQIGNSLVIAEALIFEY